jgi:hypothetical protein
VHIVGFGKGAPETCTPIQNANQSTVRKVVAILALPLFKSSLSPPTSSVPSIPISIATTSLSVNGFASMGQLTKLSESSSIFFFSFCFIYI